VLDAALLSSDVVLALRARADATRVVAFGVADEWEDVLACARAGAVGFVTRDSHISDLLAAVTSAYRGELICSPRMAARMFEHMNALLAGTAPGAENRELTLRELEIAELLQRGLSNKEIAHKLFIEQATVKNHVHNILSKLQVTRRGEAAARLRRHSPNST
jgi:DNA-binding NarL/FixJ family response regulator